MRDVQPDGDVHGPRDRASPTLKVAKSGQKPSAVKAVSEVAAESLTPFLFRGFSSGNHKFDDDASIQRLMVCVYGRNLDFVRSRRKPSDDDRPAACFGPDPRRAINRDVEMPDAGRHIERLRAEHWDDLQIFGAVMEDYDAAAQRLG